MAAYYLRDTAYCLLGAFGEGAYGGVGEHGAADTMEEVRGVGLWPGHYLPLTT